MPIILFNDGWMIYNCYLALLAVGFGFTYLQVKGKFMKVFFGILWLLFLPNTIYIFTDLEHLIFQWNVVFLHIRYLLIAQYIVFEIVGIISFLLAVIPFEQIIQKVKVFKNKKLPILIVFNFLVAFGMVLGRVERINSWEVFTSPVKVISSAIHVFSSVDLLGITILFGLFCNFVYFLFRNNFILRTMKLFHVLD